MSLAAPPRSSPPATPLAPANAPPTFAAARPAAPPPAIAPPLPAAPPAGLAVVELEPPAPPFELGGGASSLALPSGLGSPPAPPKLVKTGSLATGRRGLGGASGAPLAPVKPSLGAPATLTGLPWGNTSSWPHAAALHRSIPVHQPRLPLALMLPHSAEWRVSCEFLLYVSGNRAKLWRCHDPVRRDARARRR